MRPHQQTAEYWIQKLSLSPHPEGGFYREVYRSQEYVNQAALPERYSGDRSMSTSIYYLLQQNQVSRLHRIRSDEIWHHYAGDDLKLSLIQSNGTLTHRLLGKNDSSAIPQLLMPKTCWFGGRCDGVLGYSLLGCTVSPGFDFADFELYDSQTPASEVEIHKHHIAYLL